MMMLYQGHVTCSLQPVLVDRTSADLRRYVHIEKVEGKKYSMWLAEDSFEERLVC